MTREQGGNPVVIDPPTVYQDGDVFTTELQGALTDYRVENGTAVAIETEHHHRQCSLGRYHDGRCSELPAEWVRIAAVEDV